jgi:hypothetical protein
MIMEVSKRDISFSDNPAEDDGSRELWGATSLFYRPCYSRHPGVRQSSVSLEPDVVFTEEAHRDVAPTSKVKRFTDNTVSKGAVTAQQATDWIARVRFPAGALGFSS